MFRYLAALALLVTLSAQAQGGMILHTDAYGGHTYHLVANDDGSRITWADSEAYALTLGGHLVTVNDAAENAFVLSAFGTAAMTQAAANGHTGPHILALWIGFNDAATEGSYVWSSGAPVTYTNWIGLEPLGTSADEDYAGLVVDGWTPGGWHDVVSDFRFGDVTFGVVEVEATAVPEPASFALLSLASLGGIGLRLRQRRKSRRPQMAA